MQSRPCIPAINRMQEHPGLEIEYFPLESVSASRGPHFARWLENCCEKVGRSVRICIERTN